MKITVELPDDVAKHADPGREALEALAIEGYRSQRLSEYQVRIMLGFDTRMQVHALLKEHDVYLNYSMADLEQDIRASDELHAIRSAAGAPSR